MVNSNLNYLKNLNSNQKKAVLNLDGPCLIVAGAGSGKTKVLTTRVAHIVKKGKAFPNQILCVTFTNKAAKEMKDRVSKILSNQDTGLPWFGTFHSISARLLRREIQQLGYTNDFAIYDQDDSRSLIKKIIKDFNLDEKSFVAKSIQAQISNSKNKMITPEDMSIIAEGFMDEKISDIYTAYQKCLKQNNALDFDDLLLKPLELFNKFPNRKYYMASFTDTMIIVLISKVLINSLN